VVHPKGNRSRPRARKNKIKVL